MYVKQALDLLDGLLPSEEENKEIAEEHLEKIIIFAFMWSLGSLLEQDDRLKVLLIKNFRTMFYISFLCIF